MVDDKKKKNNKKKKNKQSNKIIEETALAANADGVGEEASASTSASASASVESQNQLTNGKNHQNGTVEVAAEVTGAANEHQLQGAESDLAQTEKHQWLQTEALLQDTIMNLRNENDMYLQKQADLEIKLSQLQNEKESWLEREVSFKEKIGLLSEDKASLVLKQENLEEKIRQLEKENDSWILKEKSYKEIISNDGVELANLKLQVAELEESKNVSGKEIQQLKEAISTFQAEIQNLESCNISPSSALDEQMKVSFKEKIALLSEDKASLILKQENLEEKIRQLKKKTCKFISSNKAVIQSDRKHMQIYILK